MPRTLKGWCTHCRGHIEIPAERGNTMVACPHCGREMPMRAAVEYRQDFHHAGRIVWIILTTIAVLSLAILLYIYRGRLRFGLTVLGDAMGGRTVAALSIVLGLLILFCLISWMLFPIVIYFSLRNLRRRTAELDETTRLCAQHLSRLTDSRRLSQEQAPRPERPPST